MDPDKKTLENIYPDPTERSIADAEHNDSDNTNQAPAAVTAKNQPSVLSIIIKSLLMLVVFGVLYVTLSIILILTGIEAFKGEVYGILQSLNGYGEAVASFLAGLIVITLFRRSKIYSKVFIVLVALLMIASGFLKESDSFNQKVTEQIREEKIAKGMIVINDKRQSIRNNFNAQSSFYYPESIDGFEIEEISWNEEFSELEITLSNAAEIKTIVTMGKNLSPPYDRHGFEQYVTPKGLNFKKIVYEDAQTYRENEIHSLFSENDTVNIQIKGYTMVMDYEAAKKIADSLILREAKEIKLYSEICNQNTFNEQRVCDKAEF